MRCILEYDPKPAQPVLRIIVHGAPHRRMHRAVLQQYRRELWAAAQAAKVPMPIRWYIELKVTYINPTGPDLGNLYLATEQALDGKCGRGPTVLADDRLICRVVMAVMFT